MSMTIKQAFQKLAMVTGAAVKNPWFIGRNLNQAFADIADNVVDAGGSVVDVVPAQDSGYLVGNVKVDGEDNYLYAPPQVPPLHIYTSEERLVAVWQHDGISEDVYEKTIPFSNATFSNNNDYEFYNNPSIKLFSGYGYLIEDGITYALPESGLRIKQNSSSIYLASPTGNWANCSGFITIRYTKINS